MACCEERLNLANLWKSLALQIKSSLLEMNTKTYSVVFEGGICHRCDSKI